MKITIVRDTFTPLSTCGQVFLDGAHECYSLEPPIKTDGTKPRAIPEGEYSARLYASPRLGRVVILLDGVPDFENVEIHYGNFPKDTHGCILVGSQAGTNEVLSSRNEFDLLMQKVKAAKGPLSVEVKSVADTPAAPEPEAEETHLYATLDTEVVS